MNHTPTRTAGHRLHVASGALMLWVALAPWVWHYSTSASAVASHIFFLFAFAPLTLLVLVLRPAAIVVLGAGVWLAVSPWVLGYATNHSAWLSDGVTGILLSIVTAHALGLHVSALLPGGAARRRARARAPVETAGSRS